MKATTFYEKFNKLPDNLKAEAINYLEYLEHKAQKNSTQGKEAIPGLAKGMIKMRDDFDEPLDDFKEYM